MILSNIDRKTPRDPADEDTVRIRRVPQDAPVPDELPVGFWTQFAITFAVVVAIGVGIVIAIAAL